MYNFFSLSFISYVIILILIFNFEFKLCFDINENVFLFDCKLLFQQQNIYNLVLLLSLLQLLK